jgi:hypothetical protein
LGVADKAGSEEIALTGDQIGNLGQAFTRLALIDAGRTRERGARHRAALTAARSTAPPEENNLQRIEVHWAPGPSAVRAPRRRAPDSIRQRVGRTGIIRI